MAIAAAALAGLAARVAHAQETEPISAERPGFTNGVETVAPGHTQVELGYRYDHAAHGGYEHTVGDSAQLRLPVNAHEEIRLGLPSSIWQRGAENATGWEDAQLSAKFRFRDAGPNRTGVALIAGTTLPTGAAGIGEHYFQPYADIETSRPLSSLWTVQWNGVYQSARASGARYDLWASGLNLGYSIGPTATAFVECFRQLPHGAVGGPTATTLDGGLTYLCSKNVVLDLNGGVGISSAVRHDYFLGAGIARRW